MKVRPGRERSLLAGVIALVVMVVGLVMMGGLGGRLGWFTFLWVLVGLGGAAASFYNAFSRRGLPLYEVDLEEDAGFCSQCGRPIGEGDRFCRHCGAPLR